MLASSVQAVVAGNCTKGFHFSAFHYRCISKCNAYSLILGTRCTCFFVTTGAGIYVQRGQSNPPVVSFNNTIVLSNIYCCSNRVQLYCYSNSTIEREKYLIWPNGGRLQTDYSNYNYMSIYGRGPSGMYIESLYSYHPQNGIYTCQLEDSNENMLDISFGLYSSMPREYTKTYAIFTMYPFYLSILYNLQNHPI